MPNLTRVDPIDNLFGDLLKGFFVRPVGLPFREGEVPSIRLDLQESDKAYQVLADIPGMNKDDIKVTIDGSLVTIEAQAKSESQKKDGDKLIYSERTQGAASRSFSLAQDVDAGAAEARYENGVLALNLPKKASTQSRQLSVR